MHLNHDLDPKISQHYSSGFTVPECLRISHHQWVQTVPDRSKSCFRPAQRLRYSISLCRLMFKQYIRSTRVGVCIQPWVWRLRYGVLYNVICIKLENHDIKYIHSACTSASAYKNACITTQNIGRNSLNLNLHTRQIHQCDEWKVLQVLRWGGLDSCRM